MYRGKRLALPSTISEIVEGYAERSGERILGVGRILLDESVP